MQVSTASDTVSVSSGGDGNNLGGLVVEEVGLLPLGDVGQPRRIVLLNYTLAALCEDGKLLLGEIRNRGGDDWTLAGRSVTNFATNGNRLLDIAIVPNAQQGGASVLLLGERKNKERYISAHHVKHGKILEVGEEVSVYDKANVLGKGVSNICADHSAPEPTIYAVSNLVRKLKLEDGGSILRPTPARAQVPNDCLDGTLAVCVQPASSSVAGANQRPASAKPQHQANVVIAFRTKSATGKNKYAIEWYSSNRKDELSNNKCTVKLSEDSEPSALLTDPRDSRSVYMLCTNKNLGTTFLFKLAKGKKQESELATFHYEVGSAALGLTADGQSVTLLALEAGGGPTARIYTIQKSEGFRGRHPACAHCGPLEKLSSPAHVVSCSQSRWQLSPGQVDLALGRLPAVQLALATLTDESGRSVLTEPETGTPYRLRIVGCEVQHLHPEAILIEDLDRTFDGIDEARLANSVLKVCLGHAPCKDCHSQLSAKLMAGKLAAIEMHYVNKQNSNNNGVEPEVMMTTGNGSDRFVIKHVSAEKFRAYVTDMDWTQMSQRQGTFTLESSSERPMSASLGTTLGPKSRIPTPRSAARSGSHLSSEDDVASSDEHSSLRSENEQLAVTNENLKAMVSKLAATLNTILDADSAVRNNLHSLQTTVEMMQESFDSRPINLN